MTPKHQVVFLDDLAFSSVDELPQPHRDVAWELLEHLRNNPRFGKPLQNHPLMGDLSDARTLYVMDFGEQLIERPPPYRIVYRLLPSERDVEVVQVIWAGPRDDGLVYTTAARRLGRS